MQKMEKVDRKTRQLAILLRMLSGVPGLGFLATYADTIARAEGKVNTMRANISVKKDDIGDARDAWDDFKGGK